MAKDKEEKNIQLSCGTSFGSKSFRGLIEILKNSYTARVRCGMIEEAEKNKIFIHQPGGSFVCEKGKQSPIHLNRHIRSE